MPKMGKPQRKLPPVRMYRPSEKLMPRKRSSVWKSEMLAEFLDPITAGSVYEAVNEVRPHPYSPRISACLAWPKRFGWLYPRKPERPPARSEERRVGKECSCRGSG